MPRPAVRRKIRIVPEETLPTVRVLETEEDAARAAAEEVVARSRAAVAARGAFRMALAGGTTPRRLYEALASDGFRDRIDWATTWVATGDERVVPPDHADSNFGMASRALLDRVPLPGGHAIRFETERADPEEAAERFARALRAACGAGSAEIPVLDVALLGIGVDAHVASLFPGSAALEERDRVAVAVRVESLGAWRLTLTPPVLEAARAVLVLASGASKAAAVRRAVEGDEPASVCPARILAGARGDVVWILDRRAASALVLRREVAPRD